jgi:selenocysteine lyase/cysteine desulfurase
VESQKHLFDLPPDLHYLNCAYMAPVSHRVADAAHAAIDRLRVPSRLGPSDFFDQSDDVRRLFARVIGAADSERVAIVPSVSYALSTVAHNTPLAAGQSVVVLDEQFPSNVYTWRRACDAVGATLKTVAAPEIGDGRGRRWNEALLDAIDEQTAVVAIPEVHWTDGTRFDLTRVGAKARACGAKLVIDATQSVGAMPFDFQGIQPDAVVCAGYKWLMGPYSIGLAYFGSAYDDGVPIEENWITRRGSQDLSSLVRYQEEYQPGAVRFDVGERSNFVLMPMLEAGLSQVLNWGPAAIQAHCQDLISDVIPRLRDLGAWIESDAYRAAHLFGVRLPPGHDMKTVQTALTARQVSVSVRGNAVRVAPHVYNDAADLDALVDSLRDVVTEGR